MKQDKNTKPTEVFPIVTEDQPNDLAVDKKRKLIFLTEKSRLLKSGQSPFLSEQAKIVKPIEIQHDKPMNIKVKKASHNFSSLDLNRLILNPRADSLNHLTNLVDLDSYYLEKAVQDLETDFAETPVNPIDKKSGFVYQNNEYRKTGDLVNIVISHEAIKKHLPEKALFYGIKRLLILTDVDTQQSSKYYRLVLKTLTAHGIKCLELSNIQPHFNTSTVEETAQFGLNYAIDGILAYGSWSLIDFGKLVIGKMTDPSIRLNLLNQRTHRHIAKAYDKTNYVMFSLTTVVSPGAVTARNALISGNYLEQMGLRSQKSQLGSYWPMLNSVDNSDCAFVLPELFAELPKHKLKELIVEVFFRIIVNFSDRNIEADVEEVYIHDLIALKGFLDKLVIKKEPFVPADYDLLSLIVARSVDGSSFVEAEAAWDLYIIEAGFSVEFNTKRSDVLSLLTPYYIMGIHQKSKLLHKRYLNLGKRLFNRLRIEGLIYELLRFNELYDLPRCLSDLIDLTKTNVDYFTAVLKSGTNYLPSKSPFFAKLLKEIPLH